MVEEFVGGESFRSPSRRVLQALAASVLGAELGATFHRHRKGPGGWWILDQPEIHLGRDVLVPDIAGWRSEKLPASLESDAVDLPPEWVCEVVTPVTARLDRKFKLPAYARCGVEHLWLVDPAQRSLDVMLQTGGRWILVESFTDRDRVRSKPFDAMEIELEHLWGLTPLVAGVA